MQRIHFDEFEAYEHAVRDANVRFTLPSLELPTWSFCDLDLVNLHVQAGLEGSGNFAEGACRDDGLVLFFQLSGTPALTNGQRLTSSRVLVMGPGAEFHIACQDAHNWATIFLPSSALEQDASGPNCRRVWQIESTAVPRLIEILRRIVAPQNTAVELETPSAIASLDLDLRVLCRKLFDCEDQLASDRSGRPPRPRKEIIDHAVSLMDGESLYSLSQIATAVNVSDRTLRNVFSEFFGVPPRQYLELRRLHRARRLLKQARDPNVTVAQVAGTVGMWDFGRFASRYRRLFGEFPSQSLRQS